MNNAPPIQWRATRAVVSLGPENGAVRARPCGCGARVLVVGRTVAVDEAVRLLPDLRHEVPQVVGIAKRDGLCVKRSDQEMR
jgi:hypothetical protein